MKLHQALLSQPLPLNQERVNNSQKNNKGSSNSLKFQGETDKFFRKAEYTQAELHQEKEKAYYDLLAIFDKDPQYRMQNLATKIAVAVLAGIPSTIIGTYFNIPKFERVLLGLAGAAVGTSAGEFTKEISYKMGVGRDDDPAKQKIKSADYLIWLGDYTNSINRAVVTSSAALENLVAHNNGCKNIHSKDTDEIAAPEYESGPSKYGSPYTPVKCPYWYEPTKSLITAILSRNGNTQEQAKEVLTKLKKNKSITNRFLHKIIEAARLAQNSPPKAWDDINYWEPEHRCEECGWTEGRINYWPYRGASFRALERTLKESENLEKVKGRKHNREQEKTIALVHLAEKLPKVVEYLES